MGYFSNGSEGDAYQARWCNRCVKDDPANGVFCDVWTAHCVWNGDPEHQADLDAWIPRSEDGLRNLQCTQFVPRGDHDHDGHEAPDPPSTTTRQRSKRERGALEGTR